MDESAASAGQVARRREGRLRVRLTAFAIMHSGTERVILCDLSPWGAKLFSRTALPQGRDFLLKWAAHEALGTIVWRRDGLHGVHFIEPLDAAAIVATRRMQDAGGLDRNGMEAWLAKTEWAFAKDLT